MARSYLKVSRHGSVYYFRRRVPDDLRLALRRQFLIKTLHTSSKSEAVTLARFFAARTDTLFRTLRTMPDQDTDALRLDLIFELDFHESGLPKRVNIVADTPEEQAQAQAMLKDALAVTTIRPAANHAPQPATGRNAGKLISDAWNAYKAEKLATNAWKDGEDTAKYDHWPHVREFIEVVGDKRISEVTADDAESFQQHVLSTQPNESERNKDKRLTRVGSMMRWACRKRTWGVTDAFSELFRFPGDIPDNNYAKFDQADLTALFESAQYKGAGFTESWQYWLPLLGLFTGARQNELCQLTRTDIDTHEGIATISILDEEIGKRLKNKSSRRIVPIHSQLIDLGFLDFVASVGEGRLFAELPEDSARVGNYAPKASEWFTAYRRSCGVGAMEGRSIKVFHSFRSTLIDALRQAEVPKDRRTRLAGHEFKDTQDRNYTGGDALTMFSMNSLKGDIETVRFDIRFTPFLNRNGRP